MKMRRIGTLLIGIAVVAATGRVNAQPASPPLAEIKAAAEKGDALAQDKLGDAYRFNGPETALIWYRRAGTQGVAHAQCEAGRILMGFSRSSSAKPEMRLAHADEGIQWLVKAANQGSKRAQVDLGREYERGKTIKPDPVEAYKWFALAAQGANPIDSARLEGQWARDAIILKMTQVQIAEGQKRVSAFVPRTVVAGMPEPNWATEIKLQGISGTGERRLAIINGQTFQKGDVKNVKVGEKKVKIRCVEVRAASVLVSIEGLEGERELNLNQK